MKKLIAFTIIEAAITMTIIGIIAISVISIIKPTQFANKSYSVLKERIYSELMSVTQNVRIACSKNSDLSKIYGTTSSCEKNQTTHTFDENVANKYLNYIKGSINPDKCPNQTIDSKTFKNGISLKSGACVWFRKILSSEEISDSGKIIGAILIDVNGSKMPNDEADRMILTIENIGIKEGIYALVSSASLSSNGESEPQDLPLLNDCTQFGNCVSCHEERCTKCSSLHTFINGSCVGCGSYPCTECNESGCTECNTGYRVSNGSCVSCGVGHCKECNESGCTKCNSGYRVSNGSCVSCGVGYCEECNESGCTKCNSYYRLSNGSCVSCKTFGTWCKECNESECTKCASGYRVSNGSCVSCRSGCDECNESECTKCSVRYRLSNGSCVSCKTFDNNCLECTESGCTECQASYRLSEGSCVSKL